MAMDVARPSNVRQKRIRRAVAATITLAAIAAVSVGLGRLQQAAPTVEASTLWPDTVKRGPMVRQVRGLGTLVPEDILWIPAAFDSQVSKVFVKSGGPVQP